MLPSIFGENLLDEFFDEPWEKSLFGTRNPLYGKHAKNLMKTDVKETDSAYVVDIDLPGFKKDEVNVELHDGYLTVTAAKGLDKDEKGEDGHSLRRERYAGSCSRSFYVGDVTAEDIKCKYDAGVLQVTVPKKDKAAIAARNRIEIE